MAGVLTDLKNTTTIGKSVLATITSDTTTNGTGVDMQLSDGPVCCHVITGDCGDASTSFYVKIEESDTSGGTYTEISTAGRSSTYTGATAGDNKAVFTPPVMRTKRWVRAAVVTSGGGVPSVPIAVSIVGRTKITGSGTGYQS